MSETKASWRDFKKLEPLLNAIRVDGDALGVIDPNDYVIHIIEMCHDWTPADFGEFRKYLEVCNKRGDLHVVREGENTKAGGGG
jgi:hypothetical protein